MENIDIEIKKAKSEGSPDTLQEVFKEKSSRCKFVSYIISAVIIILTALYFFFGAPVRSGDVIIHVSPNDNLSKIATELKNERVIYHPKLFKFTVSFIFGDRNISEGDYLFKKGEPFLKVAWQIANGKHGITPIKVTLKEGLTNEQMVKVLSDKLPGFDKAAFMKDERVRQGYLFPDTYFFYSLTTTDEILTDLTSNFKKRTDALLQDIKSSGKSLNDIIVMASIIEKEAKGKEDGAIISGILWKRIELGMPLQVDAAPATYDQAGLPREPINNPGLNSILFALHPEKTSYLFYLHDDYGNVHYAEDFSEHRSNIAKYLK